MGIFRWRSLNVGELTSRLALDQQQDFVVP
jgi:hypothetical protein